MSFEYPWRQRSIREPHANDSLLEVHRLQEERKDVMIGIPLHLGHEEEAYMLRHWVSREFKVISIESAHNCG